MLTFNLLTGYYSSLALPSAQWHHFMGIGVCRRWAVFAFFSKTTARICTKFFFQGLGGNT